MELRRNIPSAGQVIDERDIYKNLYYQLLGQAKTSYDLLEIVLDGYDLNTENHQHSLQELRKFWGEK